MFVKESNTIEDFMYAATVAQSHVSIRLGFLRKVYGILSVQLMLTTLIGFVMMYFQEATKTFLVANMWAFFACIVLNFVLMMAMFYYRQTTPHNFVALFLFTIIESITIGFVIIHFDVMAVLISLILTLIVSVSLTIYTFQTKRDFSSMGAGLFAGLVILMVGGLFQMFMQSSRLQILLAMGGAFLFSMLIVYDTWMAIHRLSPEEYIHACIDLYLDVINLFLHILRLVDGARQG